MDNEPQTSTMHKPFGSDLRGTGFGFERFDKWLVITVYRAGRVTDSYRPSSGTVYPLGVEL